MEENKFCFESWKGSNFCKVVLLKDFVGINPYNLITYSHDVDFVPNQNFDLLEK